MITPLEQSLQDHGYVLIITYCAVFIIICFECFFRPLLFWSNSFTRSIPAKIHLSGRGISSRAFAIDIVNSLNYCSKKIVTINPNATELEARFCNRCLCGRSEYWLFGIFNIDKKRLEDSRVSSLCIVTQTNTATPRGRKFLLLTAAQLYARTMRRPINKKQILIRPFNPQEFEAFPIEKHFNYREVLFENEVCVFYDSVNKIKRRCLV